MLLKHLSTLSLRLVTIESLTGGLVADAFVRSPGASKVFLGGYIVYQQAAKEAWLGISPTWIRQHHIVSEAMAMKLVEKGLALTAADIVISTTGNAGPTALDGQKVGTVFIAIGNRMHTLTKQLTLQGHRQAIRSAVVKAILRLLKDFLQAYYLIDA
jgi:nicotinamide-nucleotide amidase